MRRWVVLLASSPSLDAVERDIVYYQTLLAGTGFTVAPHYDGRGAAMSYHVSIGPFATRTEAEAAMQRVRPFIGAESELIELQFGRPLGGG